MIILPVKITTANSNAIWKNSRPNGNTNLATFCYLDASFGDRNSLLFHSLVDSNLVT